MADDGNGLSDEEYDALLSDLEGRADTSGGGGADVGPDEDLGDIDEFLESIDDGDDAAPSATATDDDDGLADEFAALEEQGELSAPPAEKPAAKQKKSSGDKSPAPQKKGDDDGEPKKPSRAKQRAKKIGVAALKNTMWFFPAVVLWWVLGVYLGQWIAAGWLIAAVAAIAVLGLPYALRRVAKRGKYRPWVLGFSLVALVVLIAPMPNQAADQMGHYGHWPASTIAEVTGAEPDAGFVQANASAASWLGELLATTDRQLDDPRQLGTIFPLDFEWPPEDGFEALGEPDDLDELREQIEQQDAL